MGKGGDLWDDSALIKAFDTAISKYKMMHDMSGSTAEENAIANTVDDLPAAEADNGSNQFPSDAEHVPNDSNLYAALETTAGIEETAKSLQINVNSSLESAKCVDSSNIQNGKLPCSSEDSAGKSGSSGKHQISFHVNGQNEATMSSNDPEEYSQLLNKYYELEAQRQNILQQLNQYSNWNDQNPTSVTTTSEEYQATVPQPYDTVNCYCPYGCQNWVVPCNVSPGSYSIGACIDKSCNAISKGSKNVNVVPPEDPDFVETAMVAAKRALSSLTKEANGGKDKQLGMDIGHFAESTKSKTDLDVVLNAWYSAGFYTGKYLTEQSSEMRKRGQDH